MNATSASDVVSALVELGKKHGGKAFLRHVAAELEKELGGDGVIAVTLTTPSGEAGELGKRVAQIIEQKYNRPVQLTEKSDKSLIGGAILQFGDQRMDVSVRGALEQFEQSLRQQAVSL